MQMVSSKSNQDTQVKKLKVSLSSAFSRNEKEVKRNSGTGKRNNGKRTKTI